MHMNKPYKKMNLLEKINYKKRQKSAKTIATTMKKIWPHKATLIAITEHISHLGNTPTEWKNANPKQQNKELNNIRKQLKLQPKNHTQAQAKKTIEKLEPLITQFDGSNPTQTKMHLGLPNETLAKNMIKQLKKEMMK